MLIQLLLEQAYENKDKFDEDIYLKWQESQNKRFWKL